MTLKEKKNLLLIFARNPRLGKVKSRLAATMGAQAALDIYTLLLQRTAEQTKGLPVPKEVHYSNGIEQNDLWDPSFFGKRAQAGKDLGERMEHAFRQGFGAGYTNIIIIGTDLYDIEQKDLERAFSELETSDLVIGPAEDGGYYLLGMKSMEPSVFRNKDWGTATVLEDTMKDLENKHITILEERNDIDIPEDLEGHPAFQQFLTAK